MKQKSVMQHQFSQIPQAEIPRSTFDRSHGYKTTFDAGKLIPFYVDEALPGDTFNFRASIFARMATPIVPIMDNLFLDTFYFAVPLRLIWDNFQRFMGEQPNPGDSTDFLVPQISNGNFDSGTLADYFGLPVNIAGLQVSSLFHRAYTLIWNEWFRDENLQSAAFLPKGDGPDVIGVLPNQLHAHCLYRGKRHDYFTSCLPWPQKGPGVEVPVGGFAPVQLVPPYTSGPNHWGRVVDGDTHLPISSVNQYLNINSEHITGTLMSANGVSSIASVYDPNGSLVADLSSATAVTINSLRQAFQLQKLYERDARGGTRYTEILRSHFSVISPDARLQRPEYLGGSTQRISINPVQQTSATDTVSPQGNLAAFGVVSSVGQGFTKSFVEHCIVIGLVNVRADLTYQQGINRMFSRKTRWDFYWPALAHLGEQAVLNKEIYAQGNSDDDKVFGYQERWAEYRYKPSLITCKFRSSDPQSLDIWHLSQDFANLPTLSGQFIVENPPINRVIAVPSEPQFLFDSYMDIKCTRPMPVYSVPGLIDHF